MLPFLELSGVVDGKGLSPFARNFETPNDLITSINTFFVLPATNPRDGTSADNKEEPQEPDKEDGTASPPARTSAILTALLEKRREKIIEFDDTYADEEEIKSNKDESSHCDLTDSPENTDPSESFFDDGEDDAALAMLRHMLSQTPALDVSMNAYKLTQACVFG